MPTCRHCKVTGPSGQWNRYAPTRSNSAQRLHRLCPACDAVAQDRRVAVAEARARGYASVANTPEYKRMQLEREAARQGRTLRDYVPRADRARVAAARAAVRISEDGAKRVRGHFIRFMLKEFNRLASTAFPEVVSALRKEQAAQARIDYQRNLAQERLRTATYKAAHPETVSIYGQTRSERIAASSDGTATKDSILEAKAMAHRCAYCDCPFEDAEKQTDHMVAVCHGGEHSMRNIVIVCRSCNARKASLTYEQWIERVQPEHRARVRRLWIARYPPLDGALPLFTTHAGLRDLSGGAA